MTPPTPDTPTHPPPDDHEARLVALEAMTKSHEERLNRDAETMAKMQADLATNTEATVSIKSDTSEIVDFFGSMKGAFKVLNWIGNLARPIGAVIGMAAAAFAAWSAYRNGTPR